MSTKYASESISLRLHVATIICLANSRVIDSLQALQASHHRQIPFPESKQSSCYHGTGLKNDVQKKQFDEKHFEVGKKKLVNYAFVIPHDENEFQIDGTLRTFDITSLHEHRRAGGLDISKHMNDDIEAPEILYGRLSKKCWSVACE